jgi:lipopolysaccharide biosynthesis glycosyltransferase
LIIACVTDRHFAELCGVMLHTLARNGNVPEAEIVICGDGLRERDRRRLAEAAERPVTHIDFGPWRRCLTGIRVSSRWPLNLFARALLADMLPRATGRLLYLDADVIVNKSIRGAFDVDMRGLPIAARHVDPEKSRLENERIGRPLHLPYFNGGVLLIDLDAWRREHMTEKVLSRASEQGKTKLPDQDAIAAVTDIAPLDVTYNWSKHHDFEKAAIIHFTREKPNTVKCNHPAKTLYLRYRAETAWRECPLQGKWSARLNRYRLRAARLRHRLYSAALVKS